MKTFLITSLLLVACDRCSKKEDSAAKDSAVESPVEEVEEVEEPKDTSS
tara:strand:+ start:644 stop:790 length:147 start_codon:yes stop_codon:yes gene_type:complete